MQKYGTVRQATDNIIRRRKDAKCTPDNYGKNKTLTIFELLTAVGKIMYLENGVKGNNCCICITTLNTLILFRATSTALP